MGVTYNNRIVTDGLVLCLDAASKRSYPGTGTTWSDLAGANDGTLTNGPTFDAGNGGSIVFDGTDDKATFTFDVTSIKTYEIWTNAVAASNALGGHAYLLHNNGSDDTTGNSYVTIGIQPTQKYYAALRGEWSSMNTGVTASNSNIVQIVLSWNGTYQKVYINSEFKTQSHMTVNTRTPHATTSIAGYRDSDFRNMQGGVYSIKAYNRALTADEIRRNYLSTKERYA
jgi:hypothetical protein